MTKAMTAVNSPPTSSTRPVPDKIPHTFDVRHDPRDQRAGFIGVVVANGEAPDVRLHANAHLGNEPLRGSLEQLCQCKGGYGLNHDCGTDHRDEGRQQVLPARLHHVVDQVLGGAGSTRLAARFTKTRASPATRR